MSAADGLARLDIGGQRFVDVPGLRAYRLWGIPVSVVVRPESIAIGIGRTGGPTAVVQTRTVIFGDKIEYEVLVGGQTLNIVRFNPADGEDFLPGAVVSLSVREADIRLVGLVT